MLDSKELPVDPTQDGADSQTEPGAAVTDPDFIPEYGEIKKQTTDPTDEWSFDFESILADIRKRTDGDAYSPAGEPQSPSADEPPASETAVEAPPVSVTPVDELDELALMREMLTTVRELTAEVRQLRAQVEPRPQVIANADVSAPDTQPDAQDEQKKPAKNKALSVISSVLFYVVIVAMVLGAFLMRSTSKGEPFMIAGFSAANVLTSSMEDVYPRGSLIITRQVDAKDLQIGDDITFMVSEDSSITHRIIGITENYQGTGARAFQTKGTKNPNPDKEMVAAANVVGRVIFHSKAIGDFANFVKDNWPILIFVLIIIIALITFLKWNARKSDGDDEDDEQPKEKKTKPKARTKERNTLPERRIDSIGDK